MENTLAINHDSIKLFERMRVNKIWTTTNTMDILVLRPHRTNIVLIIFLPKKKKKRKKDVVQNQEEKEEEEGQEEKKIGKCDFIAVIIPPTPSLCMPFNKYTTHTYRWPSVNLYKICKYMRIATNSAKANDQTMRLGCLGLATTK